MWLLRRSAASAELTWQVEKSTPAAYEPVPLSTLVCSSWAFCAWLRRTFSRLPVSGSVVSLSTLLHRRLISQAVVGAMLAFLSSSQYFWYSGQGRLHGGLRSSDADGSPILSGLFWETPCISTEPAERARGIAHPLASDSRGEGEVARTVFNHPCRQRDCLPRIWD